MKYYPRPLLLHVLDLEEQEQAIKAFRRRDAEGFVDAGFARDASLTIVAFNARALKEQDIYEKSLICAYTTVRPNRGWSVASIERLFQAADREKLRTAGLPLLPGNAIQQSKTMAIPAD